MADFSHLRFLHLVGIERKIKAGEYVDGPELAGALRKNGELPIPAEVMDYLCRLLGGDVPVPKGRKSCPEIPNRQRRMIIAGVYHRNLDWLQARKTRYGHLEGWSLIRKADFWKGTPAERAARMTACRCWHGVESWRSVQNKASSQK